MSKRTDRRPHLFRRSANQRAFLCGRRRGRGTRSDDAPDPTSPFGKSITPLTHCPACVRVFHGTGPPTNNPNMEARPSEEENHQHLINRLRWLLTEAAMALAPDPALKPDSDRALACVMAAVKLLPKEHE